MFDPLQATEKQKILVVDDDPDVLRLVKFVLHTAGYQVITATNGAEGLSKAQSEQPRLVILDVMMPEISGLEVCWRLRDIPETAHLPIIIVSAKGEVPDRVTGLHAGADDYLVKPVSADELLARVVALLSRTQRAKSPVRAPERGKIWGFVGAKGGAGVSTLVLNLATLLAQQKKPAIAVELQPNQGTFATQLKWRGGENLRHLLRRDLAYLDARAIGARLYPTFTGLRVLYGPQQVDEFGDLDAEHVAPLIEKLGQMTDYLLLDLPYGASNANRAAAQACDLMIVVVEAEPCALQCAKAQLDLMKSWDILGALVGIVLVNRSGTPGSVSLRDINQQLGSEVVGIVPFAGELAPLAIAQGLPMVVIKPEHGITASFKEILRRLTADALIGIRASA
jgi:DNA-binding response OmpR family regulator